MSNHGELLHYDATPEAAALVRVVVFGLWACIAAATPLSEISRLPFELGIPTGVVAWLPDAWQHDLWSSNYLGFVRWATFLASAVCILDWRAVRLAGPVACVAATLFQCLVRRYGHINHGEVPALLAVYVLTVFAWLNTQKRIEDWKSCGLNPYSAPPLSIAVIICTSYTLIGMRRVFWEIGCALRGSDGCVFFTNAMANWAVSTANGEGSYAFATGLGEIAAHDPWLCFLMNAGFVAVTAMECTAFFCLISSRYRALFLLTMISFHIGSLFLMRIFFWENLILYLFLVNWTKASASSQQAIVGGDVAALRSVAPAASMPIG